MNAYSSVYDQIPSHIYDAAVRHKVGIPLRGPERKTRRVLSTLVWLLSAIIIGIIGYIVYSAITSQIFSHVVHDLNSIPANQFLNYLWQQTALHHFWEKELRLLAIGIAGARIYKIVRYAAHVELYYCTEGLLWVDKKQEHAIRWSEVKEFYCTNNQIARVVTMDGKGIDISAAMMSSMGTSINQMVVDELTKRLLPAVQACYERGEEVTFGNVKVSKSGISLPKQQASWKDLGAIKLEHNRLLAFYASPAVPNTRGLARLHFRGSAGKWHTWQKQNVNATKSWPNLPVFMALVTPIIARHASYTLTDSMLSLREQAEHAWIRDKSRRRMTIVSIVVVPVCIIGLLTGYFYYQSTVEQQQAERDTQLRRAAIYQMAHQPYYAHVPGQHCDHGKASWFNDNTKNDYDCQPTGLLMTQNDFQYEDGAYFSFLSGDDDPTLYAGQYIPIHYLIQVKATFIAGGPNACVALGVHIQSSSGRQKFEVCEGGAWFYYNCASNCPEYKQIASGVFPPTKSTYLLAMDVTSTTQKLLIDGQVVGTIHDNTYAATEQVELILAGDPNEGDLVKARFFDFLYTPYP